MERRASCGLQNPGRSPLCYSGETLQACSDYGSQRETCKHLMSCVFCRWPAHISDLPWGAGRFSTSRTLVAKAIIPIRILASRTVRGKRGSMERLGRKCVKMRANRSRNTMAGKSTKAPSCPARSWRHATRALLGRCLHVLLMPTFSICRQV